MKSPKSTPRVLRRLRACSVTAALASLAFGVHAEEISGQKRAVSTDVPKSVSVPQAKLDAVGGSNKPIEKKDDAKDKKDSKEAAK